MALLTSCATAGRGSSEETDSVWAHIARPLKYWSAGASLKARANLERGQRELDARNYRVAIAALNRALWDLERIPDRALRLSELQVAYKALRSAYLALGVSDVAEEHRSMAQALANAVARERSSDGAQALGRAKQAYATARFRDAVKKLRQALIELEDVSEAEARVVQLADARCYLALSYFATEKHALVREELRRLWALEPSMAECIREAPPGVRKVIGEIQRRQKDL